MNSKECELQLNQLIIDWDEDRATRLNANDIEAIKHLMLENQMQHKEISKLKQPTIFIDTQDMEERYAEGLYMDYLKEENKQLKDKIDKAINLIVKETKSMPMNGCKIRLIELLDILKEVE